MADEIKAIIFDIGGVILRSKDDTHWSSLSTRFGLTLQQFKYLVFDSDSSFEATLGKKTAEDHFQFVCNTLHVPSNEKNEFYTQFWNDDIVDRDLIGFLRQQKKGRKTALISNAWSDLRYRLDNKYECLDAFDLAIFSCDVGLAKPDPAIYELTLINLGVMPYQSVFVDDDEHNVIAAAGLGLHAIHYHSTKQALAELSSLFQ